MEPLKVTWTSTLGTSNDAKFVDKLIRYGHIHYQCFPLNHPGEITKRPASFCYEAVERRILRDEAVYRAQLKNLMPVLTSPELRAIPKGRQNDIDPFWENPFFNGGDAKFGYAMVADLKPRTVLEVGAGNSTKFFRRAIRDFGLPTQLVAIDPVPRADLAGIADRVVQKSVFTVDLAVFEQLREGDVLFWDGSHLVSNGSDATRLFLEVLPRLKPGVVVHVHDICMPYEAEANGQVGDVSYPEQYMLGNYLLWEKEATVLLPVHYLHRTGATAEPGLSFWFVAGRKLTAPPGSVVPSGPAGAGAP